MYVARTPEEFEYDADGNLVRDGRWAYEWDGENRLVRMNTRGDVLDSGAPRQRIEFTYDSQWRRIAKRVYLWTNSTFSLQTSSSFLYDGWNLVTEASTNLQLAIGNRQSYAWGLDLSGTLQGAGLPAIAQRATAGGGGGLLSSSLQSPASSLLYCYDANGNVMALVDAADGSVVATYEYDPFGNTLRATGENAAQNPFRFSTKYTDDETGLVYYGYRFYSSSQGRWPNKDPRDRAPLDSLYLFLANSPLDNVDILGLRALSAQEAKLIQELNALAASSRRSDPEFSAALATVIQDIEGLIASVRGAEDPVGLRIGLTALQVWQSRWKAFWTYNPKVRGPTCNKYVADVLTEAGEEVAVFPRKRRPGRRPPGTGEWHDPATGELARFKVKWTITPDGTPATQKFEILADLVYDYLVSFPRPSFGDVISYPTHVGIYLGHGLYVSATAGEDPANLQPYELRIKPVNQDAVRIYRSPE